MSKGSFSKSDLNEILRTILYEFPVNSMEFYMPKWVEMLPMEHPIKENLLMCVRSIMDKVTYIKDVMEFNCESDF